MTEDVQLPAGNPFSDNIVVDPREAGRSVRGLNDGLLQHLTERFAFLAEGPVPRRKRLTHAQFITSSEPGMGKTHLGGRLFEELSKKATLIYVRPFQNAASCWRSVLLRMIQELNSPEGKGVRSTHSTHTVLNHDKGVQCADLTPNQTQLERFACGVLGGLMTELDDASKAVVPDWSAADDESFTALLPSLVRAVSRTGMVLTLPESAWIKVLYHCARSPADDRRRDVCLDWLKGEPMDDEDRRLLLLRKGEVHPDDVSVEDRNELSKHLILDLCLLAGFFRPFIFYFDQTEIYADSGRLAASFGAVVAELVDNGYNQMTVVTSNVDPWIELISPHIQRAYLDRFREPPLQLDFLRPDQARELVMLRLARAQTAESVVDRFLSDDWVDAFFTTGAQVNIRRFLGHCRERWDVFTASAASAPDSLEDLYERALQSLLERKKALLFEPDIFLWTLREVAKGAEGIVIDDYVSPRGYCVLRWRTGGRIVYFGFEDGNNWKRWYAIVREARGLHASDGAAGIVSHAVFLRTTEHKPVPGKWKVAGEIRAAMGECLALIRLGDEDTAQFYAAHELYADAVQGNIPFKRDETLSFICTKLALWWKRLSAEIPRAPVPDVKERQRAPVSIDGAGRLSVSDVVSACLDPGWPAVRERSTPAGPLDGLRGSSVQGAPSELRAGSGRPAMRAASAADGGLIFHEMTERFIAWLTSEETKEEAGKLSGTEALRARMDRIFADRAATASSLPDSKVISYVRKALAEFCKHLMTLRKRTKHFRDWRDVFISAEQPLDEVLFSYEGKSIAVSGRIDALRTHPVHDAEIVDYKLRYDSDRWRNMPQRDLLQLAIYAELIRRTEPARECAGTVEYYGPSLLALTVTAGELKAIFDREVDPVLRRLVCGAAPATVSSLPGPVIQEGAERAGNAGDAGRDDVAGRIEECFRNFKLDVSVVGRHEAPQVVRYRVAPAAGVKFVSLANRSRDLQIALSLSQPPLVEPAQGYVTIDVPKDQPDFVLWEEIVGKREFIDAPGPLSFPVGVGMDNQVIIADFSDPNTSHALVAGATGSGKSVFLKNIFASLVRRNSPQALQFIIVDPKVMTFGAVGESPYLKMPVITDIGPAIDCLHEAAREMDRRCRQLAAEGFESLSARHRSGKGDIPFIVIIVDEFADLILTGKREKQLFEQVVARLVAKGRAAGIHLVLATQRPDKDIVTGKIKANLPLKVCFRVVNSVNSEIVLDQPGAESLLGKGDLLCSRGRGIERAQAPFTIPP